MWIRTADQQTTGRIVSSAKHTYIILVDTQISHNRSHITPMRNSNEMDTSKPLRNPSSRFVSRYSPGCQDTFQTLHALLSRNMIREQNCSVALVQGRIQGGSWGSMDPPTHPKTTTPLNGDDDLFKEPAQVNDKIKFAMLQTQSYNPDFQLTVAIHSVQD